MYLITNLFDTRVNVLVQDTQWLDIDYMKHYNDFVVDPKFKGLEHFSYELHKVRSVTF